MFKLKIKKTDSLFSDGTYVSNGHFAIERYFIQVSDSSLQSLINKGRAFNKGISGLELECHMGIKNVIPAPDAQGILLSPGLFGADGALLVYGAATLTLISERYTALLNAPLSLLSPEPGIMCQQPLIIRHSDHGVIGVLMPACDMPKFNDSVLTELKHLNSLLK